MSDDLAARLAAAGADPGALRAVALDASSDDVKSKEAAVAALTDALVAAGDAPGLAALLTELRPLFGVVPKAKTAKIVRAVVEAMAKVPGSEELQLSVCRDMSAWARTEKRTFLRQRIDARLAALLIARGDSGAALDVIASLLAEVKRLDDKLLLVDVHLLEARARRALRDGAKARAALTAARAAASSTYVPPALQADVDALSGTLHADEKDYRTAFSYFYEAFDALGALDPPRAAAALKHMLLCKVMMGDAGDVPGLVAAKAGAKFGGAGVDAMVAVAAAYAKRSLADLDAALAAHAPALRGDDVVAAHIDALADGLLQANLARLVEPFDRVEVAHLASLLSLPVDAVLAKLSQMILDGALDGTLDAGSGCLETFPPTDARGGYAAAKDAFAGLGRAVDALFARSQKLSAASS